MTSNICKELTISQRIHFRDQFKQARTVALKDAEAFHEIVFALERFGTFLLGKPAALGKLKPCICDVAKDSPLKEEIPKTHREFHTPLDTLYDMVRNGRNDALHQGAFARHLTVHAIALCLVLEDALMSDANKVSDYMVNQPVCAYAWQPLSFIRQTMLTNSFSYLPVYMQNYCDWYLVSDLSIAQYVRDKGAMRKDRLNDTLEKAFETLNPEKALTCKASDFIQTALEKMDEQKGLPLLIKSPDEQYLLGILTPFDLL